MIKVNDTTQIRISKELKLELENLEIQTGGINITTLSDKIQHLYWHYKHYKNNNGE